MLGLHGGIQFRQVRALPNMDNIDRHGYRPTYGSVLDVSVGLEKDVDKSNYGYGEFKDQFKWFSAEELGMPPQGVRSPSTVSTKWWPSGGYVAYILPFFSDVKLKTENGTADQITDYRPHTGPGNPNPKKYYCVRTSVDGVHIRQTCDGPSGD